MLWHHNKLCIFLSGAQWGEVFPPFPSPRVHPQAQDDRLCAKYLRLLCTAEGTSCPPGSPQQWDRRAAPGRSGRLLASPCGLLQPAPEPLRWGKQGQGILERWAGGKQENREEGGEKAVGLGWAGIKGCFTPRPVALFLGTIACGCIAAEMAPGAGQDRAAWKPLSSVGQPFCPHTLCQQPESWAGLGWTQLCLPPQLWVPLSTSLAATQPVWEGAEIRPGRVKQRAGQAWPL